MIGLSENAAHTHKLGVFSLNAGVAHSTKQVQSNIQTIITPAFRSKAMFCHRFMLAGSLWGRLKKSICVNICFTCFDDLTISSILVFLCTADKGPRLSVAAEQTKVVSRRGGNATLPCKIQRDQSLAPNRKMRIKWTKLTSDYLKEVGVHI